MLARSSILCALALGVVALGGCSDDENPSADASSTSPTDSNPTTSTTNNNTGTSAATSADSGISGTATSSTTTTSTDDGTSAASDGSTSSAGSSSSTASGSSNDEATAGATCPPDPSDDACRECVKDNCCEHWAACQNDTTCQCFLDCHLDGGSIGSCNSSCGDPEMVYNAVYFCGQMYCLNLCEWDCC